MAGSRGKGPGAADTGGSSHEGPSPDGHHDDLDPQELQRLNVEIPHDASELDVDRERWLAEEALEAETDAESPHRPTTGSWAERRSARRRRLVLTAAVVLVSMLTVAISGAVGAWIVGPQASPQNAPLADPGPAPGHVGGLLPDEAVLLNGEGEVGARSVRPAVIALIPLGCLDCDQLLSSLAPEVESFGLPLVAVGEPGQSQQLDELADAVGSTHLMTMVDPAGDLRATYGLTGTILVLVGADGVVADIVHEPAPAVRLDGTLVDLVPGVGTGT